MVKFELQNINILITLTGFVKKDPDGRKVPEEKPLKMP